jgi:FAD dependent oxidoreductase
MQQQSPTSHDLIVYGATPAGILAAVTASRRGISALIIEPTTHIGGLVTSGLNAADLGAPALVQGVVREFFLRAGRHYGLDVEWRPEPHVASAVLKDMLREAHVAVRTNVEIAALRVDDKEIAEARLSTGEYVSAPYWIDATYEGDLLPLARVSHVCGRESKSTYGETHAGRGEPRHMLPWGKRPVSPLDSFGRRLKFVADYDQLRPGEGDHSLQAYSFRLTLTQDPDRRIPVPHPSRYNPTDYELFRRLAPLDENAQAKLVGTTYSSGYFNLAALPNKKYDMNSGHVFPLNVPGLNTGWIDGTRAMRASIYEQYKEYTLAMLYFMRTDASVPAPVRTFFSGFGLCADEYAATDGWPPALYVREGRRLLGEHVLTEHDILTPPGESDEHVGSVRYPLDCKPHRWMVSADGTSVVREGMLYVSPPAYPLPYRMLLPKRSECSNLLVVCAASASHVAFASLRMEPHWMLLGVAAGYATSLAQQMNVALHDVPPGQVRAAVKRDICATSITKPPVNGPTAAQTPPQ